MKKLCLIGGISTVGKSELIRRITSSGGVFRYNRFHHAIKDEFARRGIDIRQAKEYWAQVVPVAASGFIASLNGDYISLSDIHFAVQPEYDLLMHIRKTVPEPIDEPYICGVDDALIRELRKNGKIEVKTVLLIAPLDEILERRVEKQRTLGFARSLSMKSITQEFNEELRYFQKVNSMLGLGDNQSVILSNQSDNLESNVTYLRRYLNGS